MKRKILFLSAVLCLFGGAGQSVQAEETENGYLLTLKPNAVLPIAYADGYERKHMISAPEYCSVGSMEEIEKYIGMENVEKIEPIYTMELHDSPNDTYYGGEETWGYTEIHAEYARLAGIDGDGVKIGIIDSGINAAHEEFADTTIAAGRNFVGSAAADVEDTVGHGTAVAGVIAAGTDNAVGICGIAPQVTIVPYRAFSANTATTDVIADAIRYAADEGCDILNMSFGMTADVDHIHDAIRYAAQKGVILLASAGNDGKEVYNYPASYAEVISVAATGEGQKHAMFSQRNDAVFVTAPGQRIRVLSHTNTTGYVWKNGTSFSCPAAAAAAALVYGANGGLTQQELERLLRETAVDLTVTRYEWGTGQTKYENFYIDREDLSGRDVYYGYGLLNVEELLKEVGVTLAAPHAEENESGQLAVCGYLEGLSVGEEVVFALAGYDANGKMIAYFAPKAEEIAADRIGIAEVRVAFSKEYDTFEKLKWFWVGRDGNLLDKQYGKVVELIL